MKTLSFKIKGTVALLMHSERLVNPLDPLKIELAKLTGKRTKTEDDHAAISRLEFEAGLYHDADLGPCIPGQNLDRMLYDAAKRSKKGEAVKRGLLVIEEKTKLLYDGPRTVAELFAQPERFVDIRSAVVQRRRVMRTRPIFREWAVEFSVGFDESELEAAEIAGFLALAGRQIGLGDFRPRYGRFSVA